MKAELLELLPALRRYAWSMTHSVHDADDLLQATVERLLRKGVPEGADLTRWSFTVCRNLWIDEYRSRKTWQTTELDPELTEAGQVDGESHVQAQMQLKQVMTAIKLLPNDQQMVLNMVTVQGLSYQEVADSLEIPLGTVMSRLARARGKLTELLKLRG
jgi:RNA polymerase sigma factor (sigma-70 family)